LKLTEFFLGDDGRALRVSRYLAPEDCEPHVRFSLWSRDGRAEAAVPLGEHEAARLARFVGPAAQPVARDGALRRALSALGRS
jgi:hypothetical protein